MRAFFISACHSAPRNIKLPCLKRTRDFPYTARERVEFVQVQMRLIVPVIASGLNAL
jgi:hypothetical protein